MELYMNMHWTQRKAGKKNRKTKYRWDQLKLNNSGKVNPVILLISLMEQILQLKDKLILDEKQI
jgi:hypothetical protein